MPVANSTVAVQATPTILALGAGDINDRVVCILYNVGAADLFIGGPAVTTATGVKIAIGATSAPIVLSFGDTLYGVCAAPQNVNVLRTRT